MELDKEQPSQARVPTLSVRLFSLVILLGYATSITCPPYTPPTNGQVFPTTSRKSGQTVTIACNAGYALSEEGDQSPICLGEQGYSIGKNCRRPASCGKYTAPIEGAVDPPGDIPFGIRVNISCNSGYVLGAPEARTPICRAAGDFEQGSECERVPLTCLSSFSSGLVQEGDPKYFVETCHPETQYCVTARSPGSTYVWRGCGPPVVRRGNESLVVLPEWTESAYLKQGAEISHNVAWLSSNFICPAGQMSGSVELPPQAFGAGVWEYRCCCSHSCNAGSKCIFNPLPTFRVRRKESSTVALHTECPLPSQGCYTIEAGQDDSGWRLQAGSFKRIEYIADPSAVAELVFETTSGRPPEFGEEFIGYSPTTRAATDSWLSPGARIQFIDVGVGFPTDGEIKAWEVYGRTPGRIQLQVWRAQPPSGPGILSYQLVDEKSLRISGYGSAVTFESSAFGGPIAVQQGDVIGWAHTGPGLIEYDELLSGSTSVYFLYGRPGVGDTADFALGVKRAYSIRAYFDNATIRDSNPLPTAKGCYDRQLGRFGLRCSEMGGLGARVVAQNSSGPALPNLNVMLFEGQLYQFSCCRDSLCNQEYCVRPADSCGRPPSVEDAIVTPNDTHLVYRQTVAVQCNAGYLPGLLELNATDKPMCQRDGSFDRAIQCFPIVCGAYTAPKHSTVAPEWSVRTGEEVVISCNAGYSLRGEGSARVRCLGDGSFEAGLICAPSDYGLVVGTTIGFFLLNATLGMALAFVVSRRREIKKAVLIRTEDIRLWAKERRLKREGKSLEDDEWEKDGLPKRPKRNLRWVHGVWESLIQLFSPSTVRGGGSANSRIRQGDFIAVASWDGVGPLPTAHKRKAPVGVGSANVNVGWPEERVEEAGEGAEEGEGDGKGENAA